MTEAPQPQPASTVILIRSRGDDRFEIFMTRRPNEMKFMGGCYVFPGGSVGGEDWSEDMLGRCRGLSRHEAQKLLGSEFSPELSLAHWVAGIRELFEEAGVLLSVTENGDRLIGKEEDLNRRLAEKRGALLQGSVNFRSLLESEDLFCDVGRPVYFSHRVTPEKYSMRFDTRFFLAPLPEDQKPLCNSEEVTESLWTTPEEALLEAEKGRFPLMPPTVAMLRTLAAFNSWGTLCTKYSLR